MSALEHLNKQNATLEDVNSSLRYAMQHSPFYKKLLNGKVSPDGVDSFEAFFQLPFTDKNDISENNRDFLAVPLHEVAEFVTTSGTVGEPVTIYLTENDLERLAENEYESFKLAGATEHDIFQLMTTTDKQFMAGLAYNLGVRKLKAGMVRIGPGAPAMQWKSILQYQPGILIAVPGFVLSLIDYAIENRIDYQNSAVNKIICIGEPIRNSDFTLNTVGNLIKEKWDVDLFSTYASTEMGAAFTECHAHEGCHLNPNLIFLEVIKEDGNPALEGEIGEVVITTLGVTGTPLIRYKTGDLTTVYTSPCKCGNQSLRLGSIIGRKNQMIKFKGTTLFPKSIFDIFDEIEAVKLYKVEITKDELNNDQITVCLDKALENTSVMYQIVEQCRAKIRVIPTFKFADIDYLRNSIYKTNIRKPEKILFRN